MLKKSFYPTINKNIFQKHTGNNNYVKQFFRKYVIGLKRYFTCFKNNKGRYL